MKKIKYIKSPINYAGGKYRLLKKIIPLFPKNIDTFVDLFGGAFNVGINVEANNIVYNDIIHYLSDIYKWWKTTDLQDINNYIDETIEKNELSSTNNDSFIAFRKKYNSEKDIRDLFVLICYSFNYQMRFNNSHEYNSSYGKEASTMNQGIRNNLNRFVKELQSKNIEFHNENFVSFDFDKLNSGDFVYSDSPYSIGNGVYQDGRRGFNGWSLTDDACLFEILDDLDNRDIKFAMSNVIENKGLKNEPLIEWSKKYNINYLDMNYNGSNYQRKKSKSIEVLITNY